MLILHTHTPCCGRGGAERRGSLRNKVNLVFDVSFDFLFQAFLWTDTRQTDIMRASPYWKSREFASSALKTCTNRAELTIGIYYLKNDTSQGNYSHSHLDTPTHSILLFWHSAIRPRINIDNLEEKKSFCSTAIFWVMWVFKIWVTFFDSTRWVNFKWRH